MTRKMRDSVLTRWTVLGLVSVAMMSGYIISDIAAPLQTMFAGELGWNAVEYGTMTSGYGWFNVFFLMLILAGLILDRMGVRFTGVTAIIVMMVGTAIKFWAISTVFENPVVDVFDYEIKKSVLYATVGFAVFGVGVEMVGITATKAIVRWFKGKEMAMAIGMNTAFGRIGTFLALYASPKIAIYYGSVAKPILFGLVLLCVGLLSYLVFCVLDTRLDREVAGDETDPPEEPFRFRDLKVIATNSGFWLITLLCILFYSAVFPFLKYASDFMVQKFDMPIERAGDIPSLLPLGTLFLTPLFGLIYDHKGRGATIMIIGSVLLVVVHTLFSVPALDGTWIAVVLMILLGVAFSLVPSAMWPSVAKIIPTHLLGTAYGMIFWFQNIGLAGVPFLVGWVLDRFCRTGEMTIDGVSAPMYDYTYPMLIFAGCGILSVFVALFLRRSDARNQYGLEKPNIRK